MRQFRPEHVRTLCRAIFVAAGWPDADATETARHLTLANLSGHDSHGIGMVPLYIRAYRDGLLKPENAPVDRINAAPFLVIDGNVALGQPTATRAVARGADMALANGVAILNLMNAHHIGRIGDYAEQAAARGLVSMFWVNVAGRPPIVAPHGSREGRWGTNPHAVGIPSPDGHPLILDFATSRMAHGKARVALNKGEAVSPGYLIDAQGQPTTDPAVVFPPLPMGALLPFGDHKGAGLSFIVELLSAGLGGGALIQEAPHLSRILNSLFAVLIDPQRLDPDKNAQAARISAVTAFLRSAMPQNEAEKVKAPGDRERELRITRERDGIPIDDETWRQVIAAAESVGVDAENP